MLIAGKSQNHKSIELLITIVNGDTVTTHPLPDVPASEFANLRNDEVEVAPDCSDAEVASLALAYLQHHPAKELLERANPQTDTHLVAMALLGDSRQLKPEHFQTENGNYELSLAAIEAVVRVKGRHQLESAIMFDTSTPNQEQGAPNGLAEMLRTENAPGIRTLRQNPDPIDLYVWYHRFGDEYLKRFDN